MHAPRKCVARTSKPRSGLAKSTGNVHRGKAIQGISAHEATGPYSAVPPCRASWSSASPSLDSEVFSTVPPYLAIASVALSGVTFSTIRNSAEVPGCSMPRTWSWNSRSIPVPDDRRDGVGLDDEIPREPARLLGGGLGGGLVGVADGDQVSHNASFSFCSDRIRPSSSSSGRYC